MLLRSFLLLSILLPATLSFKMKMLARTALPKFQTSSHLLKARLSSSFQSFSGAPPPPTNALIDLYKTLATQNLRPTDDNHQLTILEGPKLINDVVLKYDAKLHSIVGSQSALAEVQRAIDLQGPAFNEVYEVPQSSKSASVFKRISSTKTPQEVVAAVRMPQQYSDPSSEEKPSIVLVLDSLQDPGNVGTLIRTLLAIPHFPQAGSSESSSKPLILTLPGTAHPFSPKTIRASGGAVFGPLQFKAVENVEEVKEIIRGHYGGLGGVFLCTMAEGDDADKEKPSISHYEVDYRHQSAFNTLILGSEGSGISPQFTTDDDLKTVGNKLHVEMGLGGGGTESLNVGVVGSVVLFEMARQGRVLNNAL
jgi:TrmH family RNA methyltransferase